MCTLKYELPGLGMEKKQSHPKLGAVPCGKQPQGLAWKKRTLGAFGGADLASSHLVCPLPGPVSWLKLFGAL